MIILHAGSEEPLYFDPTKIVCAQRDASRERTRLWTVEGAEPAFVDEAPADIARLLMAWNKRSDLDSHAAYSGSSVIAIALDSGSIIATYAQTDTDTGQ